MDQFLQDAQRPSWWIGVVLVSLALNVLASYLRELIDKCLRRFLAWRRSCSAQGTIRAERFPSNQRPVFATLLGYNPDFLSAACACSVACRCPLLFSGGISVSLGALAICSAFPLRSLPTRRIFLLRGDCHKHRPSTRGSGAPARRRRQQKPRRTCPCQMNLQVKTQLTRLLQATAR